VAWPAGWDEAARRRFADGLAADQAEFGVVLLGGDTVATPGPFTASVTALGYVPAGEAVRRSGARPGERVFVTGTIGDGWLGLRAARGELPELSPEHQAALTGRYRLPLPRLEFRQRLLAQASACADVSDGLAADLGHVARASGVAASIDLEALPLSEGARAWLSGQSRQPEALAALATGGDDYELVFTAGDAVEGAAEIGRITAGEGVRVLFRGEEVPLQRRGWSHP
jgi:thiamine-monophosphate kinase